MFDTTEVGVAVQVAFIIAGCTHSTYYRVLQHGLRMEPSTFMSTIKRMHPVVKATVDEMCEEAKADMKSLLESCGNLCRWSMDDTWFSLKECHI